MKKSLVKISCGLALGLALFLTGCNSSIPTTGQNPVQNSQQMHVNLAWHSTPGAQLGFYVEGSIDGTNYVQLLAVPDGVNTASIPVQTGYTYYFRMRSFNANGTSPYTQVVTAKL